MKKIAAIYFHDIPLPEVYYAKDGKPAVKLFLGKDFAITYRNNRAAGMAELIIRGRGKYRGKRAPHSLSRVESGELPLTIN